MRILLTNDDGYRAPGINAAYIALIEAGHDVIIVAPELNSSGAGQSIAVYMPMSITKVAERIYFVTSTPADSVRLGLHVVYKHVDNYPDLVVSGINLGENLAEDTLYSGTVGAAREAVVHGVPGLAFSTPGPKYTNLDSAAKVIVDLVGKLEKNPQILTDPFIWNVNIPNLKYEEIDGYEATELGMRQPHKPMEKQTTPRGDIIYWQGAVGEIHDPAIGTDLAIFLKGKKVSITPIEIFATNYNHIPVVTALTI